MNDQLIPRLPRKKKQPTADQMRATIVSLLAENERLRRSWCARLSAFLRRLRSTDKTSGESTT